MSFVFVSCECPIRELLIWGGLRLFSIRTLFVLSCSLVLSSCTDDFFTFYTPGDTVGNSSQSLVVKGYHPDQPLPFNHQRHTVERGMDCEYCHSAARRSISAGIPSLETCMGCHKVVKTDSEPIKQLTEAYNNNMPIKWIKVHDGPDFVRFSHRVHVQAKDPTGKDLLDCQTCHGQVQGMHTASQYAPMQMSWCVECHNKVKIPAKDGKPEVRYAPISCNTCHF